MRNGDDFIKSRFLELQHNSVFPVECKLIKTSIWWLYEVFRFVFVMPLMMASASIRGVSIYYRFLLVLIVLAICSVTFVQGQSGHVVSGKIVSKKVQGGIPNVNIRLKGTNVYAISDKSGGYKISVNSENDVLVFSLIGFFSKEIRVGAQTKLDVLLVDQIENLNEVVVVGYSEQTREKTTASVVSLNTKELENVPSVNPIQALQGKLAGVSVPVLSGQPGAGAGIVIRGGTTLNPYGTGTGSADGNDNASIELSEPLVIVDGVFRSMDDVNADDIESLQVLKDAASTAAYGARGANGVIVVKTKGGKFNSKSTVTFRYQQGIETQARDYEYLNGREYIDLARRTWQKGIDAFDINQKLYSSGNSATTRTFIQKGQYGRSAYTTAYLDNLVDIEGQEYVDNLLSKGWETMDDPVNPGHTIIFKDNHYQDVVWNQANTENYNIAIDGGSDRVSYNTSLGYIDQGGIFLGTNYKRFSSNSKVNFKVSNKFSLESIISYLWNDNKYINNNLYQLTRGVRIPPLNRLYEDSGLPFLGEATSVRNRLHELYYQDLSANTDQTTLRLAGDLKIIPGLVYRPSISAYINQYRYLYFDRYYPQQLIQREKVEKSNQNKQLMTDHILQYTKSFQNMHNLMVLAGFNYTRTTFFNFGGTGQRATNDYNVTFSGDPQTTEINGIPQPNFTLSSNLIERRTASFFSQATYDYKARYLFAASLRYDGFSNFAKNNQYALFPSVSAGWNIHKESFWKIQAINSLKLRASYGSTGLSGLDYTDTYGGYGAAPYGANGGILLTKLPNPNLLWESTETVDAAVDMSIVNRIDLTVEIYNKLTSNRLDNLPLAAESGFSSIRYNIGKLRNKGVEIEFGAKIFTGKNFKWNTNFTFAFNKTAVVELPSNDRDKNRINGGLVYDPKSGKEIEIGGYAEGERPGGLWAWESKGIYATDEEASNAPKDLLVPSVNQGKPKHGGDVIWNDLNNDGQIDGKDLVFVGYRVPDKIGGLQNTFNWKGFTLRFTVDYALGHVINNGALARSMGQARGANEGAPSQALQSDVWQNTGDVGKKYPRFSFGDADFGYRNHVRQVTQVGYQQVGADDWASTDNTIYYSKGDFLAFREVSVSYGLPIKFKQKLKIQSVILNAGVYNIGYITAYKGLNPEIYKGIDAGGYPRPRQFTLGATLKF